MYKDRYKNIYKLNVLILIAGSSKSADVTKNLLSFAVYFNTNKLIQKEGL
jgi:hypothetical protein